MSSFAQRFQLGPFFQAGALQGAPLLWHYATGTTTTKNIWSDRQMTTPLAQPFEADADGIFNFFADGLYDIVVTAADGTVLYTLPEWQLIDRADPTFAEGTVIASASTIAVGPEVFAHIGGSASIGTLTGTIPFFWAVFDGNPSLVNSANLLLPDARDRKMRAGDVAFFLNDGAGVWRLAAHLQTEGSYTGRYGATVAASTTLAVPKDGDIIDLSGGAVIEGIATAQAGYRFRVRFTNGGNNLIYNATSFLCPFETDYQTVLNEIIEFVSLGLGNWLVIPQCGAPQLQPGTPMPWFGTTAPKGGLLCNGANINCTTYPGLAKVLVPVASTLGLPSSIGSFTVNTGTDALVIGAHGLSVNDIVHVTNAGGGLPAPLTANTVYFVKTVIDSGNFTISATRGGATIDITTAGTGTHSVYRNMKVPDLRGRTWVGLDNLGGSSANIITDVNADVLGGVGGTEILDISRMPAHIHPMHTGGGGGGTIVAGTALVTDAGNTTGSTGGGAAFNEPFMACAQAIRF